MRLVTCQLLHFFKKLKNYIYIIIWENSEKNKDKNFCKCSNQKQLISHFVNITQSSFYKSIHILHILMYNLILLMKYKHFLTSFKYPKICFLMEVWYFTIWIYHNLFIQYSISRNLDFFHFFMTINTAAVTNLTLHIFKL